MQKEKLIVKNFFTLKDIEIELGKFNVFIGEQASGKSLLVKLVYFFRNVIRLPISSYQNSEEQIMGYVTQYFKEIFRLDVPIFQQENWNVEYHFNDKFKVYMKYHEHKLNVTVSNDLKSSYENYRAKLVNIHNQLTENNSHPINLQQGIMQTNIFDTLGKSEFGVGKISYFLPAGRTFLVSLQKNIFNTINSINADSKLPSIDPLLLLFGQQYQDAIESFGTTTDQHLQVSNREGNINWFDTSFKNVLKGKYIYDVIGGYISQPAGDVRPWHGSSGQQESLPIYLVLRNYLLSNQPGYLYIEEPEAHLYPTAQKSITELLVYVTNATNSSGLHITTHSPYILTVLNNLITSNEVKDKQTNFEPNLLVSFEDVRVYFIAEGTAHSLMNEEYRIIDAEKLDEVSNIISQEYSKMVDLL